MNKKNDGGPAYPHAEERMGMDGDFMQKHYSGMSLRDWFAGQALAGMLAYYNGHRGDFHTNASYEATAEEAYRRADAMLAERDKETTCNEK